MTKYARLMAFICNRNIPFDPSMLLVAGIWFAFNCYLNGRPYPIHVYQNLFAQGAKSLGFKVKMSGVLSQAMKHF
jgi:hypothetical protein